jgi:CheY-like chemotaxis protein
MAAKAEIIRVLLLEDNMSMRTIIHTILQGLGGFEVYEAADTVSASRIVRERRIDLALVDFQLERGDGVQFVRDIRRSPADELRFLPIIMVTGHSERLRVEEARDAGVSEFVAKPLTAQALMARLEAAVMRPRPFVSSADYFGPDRRRRRAGVYAGPFRRADDPQRTATARERGDILI